MKGGEPGDELAGHDSVGDTVDDIADDIVGIASARLMAAGVPVVRRRHALRLLGVLQAVAGADLRVRRPLRDVAVEFGLPPHEVDGWLDELVWCGAVRWEHDELVLAGAEPPALGALRLHDFLALAEQLDQPAPVTAAPVVPRRRIARPAVGMLAAAAVLVVALLAGNLPDDEPDRTITASGVRATSTTTARSTTSTTASPGTATVPINGVTTTPTATTTPGPPPCPADAPVLEVLQTIPEANGGLAITGLARNPSDAAVVIHTIVVQGAAVPVELTVPGGGTAPWSATLDQLAPAVPVDAGLGDWEWAPPLPPGCRP